MNAIRSAETTARERSSGDAIRALASTGCGLGETGAGRCQAAALCRHRAHPVSPLAGIVGTLAQLAANIRLRLSRKRRHGDPDVYPAPTSTQARVGAQTVGSQTTELD